MKGWKLYSIFGFRCPHCHEGKFFEGNPIKANVKDVCDKCGTPMQDEPGFYQGSYYVAYALGVAIFVASWVATAVLTGKGLLGSLDDILYIAPVALIITVPITYPMSKIIWANFFFDYKGKKNEGTA